MSTLAQVKKELTHLSNQELADLCLRMAKYKKENKELLSYLLFDTDKEHQYIEKVNQEVDEVFKEMNTYHPYLAKKTIRKALRIATKYIKYSGLATTEIEILMHFCRNLNSCGISIRRYPVLVNLYDRQIKKIQTVISKLHEDLQYDYENELEESGLLK